MRRYQVDNLVDMSLVEVRVNVDIEIIPRVPPSSIQEKLALQQANSQLGVLGFDIQQHIKKQILEFFKGDLYEDIQQQ